MKNLTKKMMIAAAALVVAAGVAQAQTIQAEIPFSFRAVGTVMPAGKYVVDSTQSRGGSPVFLLVNSDAHRSMMAMAYMHGSVAPGADPKLTFECSGAHCALVRMSNGNGDVYGFRRPSLGHEEPTRVAVIRAVLVKAR